MIKLQKRLGSVYDILRHAVDVATVAEDSVSFEFNNVKVVVRPKTVVSSLVTGKILDAVQERTETLYI
ncbi:MAG: hypothetical protein GY928_28155 [Colwellia sp.]|nr:hypothetical protein [Colwellia sp.]